MNDRSIGNNNRISGKIQSDFNSSMKVASFEKTLTFSTEAGKSIIYINGGAAVSMLTFCGRYIGKLNIYSIIALGAFGLGALAGVLALFISYAAQGNYTHDKNKQGDCYNKWAIKSGIASGALFIIGLLFGAIAIWLFNDFCVKNE